MTSFTDIAIYWVVFALIVFGLYLVMASNNLVKKIVGLNIFQAGVFVLYISMGKIQGASAPILNTYVGAYSNPLPHVLILTAIVVGVATTAVGLALIVRIKNSYDTIEESEIIEKDLDEK